MSLLGLPKVPQTVLFKKTNLLSYSSGGQKQDQGVGTAMLSLKALREDLFWAPLPAAGGALAVSA